VSLTASLALMLALGADGPPRPTEVIFAAPDGCPTRERFEQELVFRTTRVRPADAAEATAHLDVSVTQQGKRFNGRVAVRTDDGKNIVRAFGGPRCESVVAALSLAAALVLDPEGTKTGALPAALPPLLPIASPPVTVTEPKPVVVDPLPPAPTVSEPEPVEVVELPLTPPPTNRVSGAVTALGLLSTAVSGSADFGGGLAGELELRLGERLRWNTSLALGAQTGRTITAAAGSAAYAFGLIGLLDVGVVAPLLDERLRPRLGLALELTSLDVTGLGADANSTSRRWLAAIGPTASLGLALGGWRFSVDGLLAINLVREQYRVLSPGVTSPADVVFSVPGLAAVASLRIGREFR